MKQNEDIASELERNARTVLRESLTRIDARTRSRLNQARQRAAAEAVRPSWAVWSPRKLMPLTGALAAVLVAALLLFGHRPGSLPAGEGGQPLEVLDLLADEDNLSLMEDYDHSYFYEWAADQGDAGAEPASEASG